MEGQPSAEHMVSHKEAPKQGESLGRKTVEVNGRVWSYLEYGNPKGIPILEVHGWGGAGAEGNDWFSRAFAGEVINSSGLQTLARNKPESAQSLANTIRSLEGKYHIIVPELPGSGVTEPLERISINNLVDELAEFAKATNMKGSIAVGNSAGGIYVTKLAARHPELETKAVVLEGTMTRPSDMDKMLYLLSQVITFGPIPNILIKFGLDKKLWAFALKKSKDYQVASEEIKKWMLEATMRGDSKTTVKLLREIGRDIGENIKKVECPVVVLDGAHGDMVPILKQAKQATRFHPEISPNSEKIAQRKMVFLPIGGKAGEQGHGILSDFPEGLVALIDTSLNKMITQDQNSSG